jgi:hypothetical protein
MVESLFFFKFLELEILNANDIIYYCYCYIWTLQILIAFIFCICTKRFLPFLYFNKRIDHHFLLNQLNIYFIGMILIYLFEIYYDSIYWTMFEKFLHHIFAILLFLATIYEPNTICFFYLLPTLVHAIYCSFSKPESQLSYLLLMSYNLLMIIAIALGLVCCYWKYKCISMRCPLFATMVFNSNMMGYFYGYDINFEMLDKENFAKSIVKSIILTTPLYLCLIYTFSRGEQEKKKKLENLKFHNLEYFF